MSANKGYGRYRMGDSDEAAGMSSTDRDLWMSNRKKSRNPRDVVRAENIMWEPSL